MSLSGRKEQNKKLKHLHLFPVHVNHFYLIFFPQFLSSEEAEDSCNEDKITKTGFVVEIEIYYQCECGIDQIQKSLCGQWFSHH